MHIVNITHNVPAAEMNEHYSDEPLYCRCLPKIEVCENKDCVTVTHKYLREESRQNLAFFQVELSDPRHND